MKVEAFLDAIQQSSGMSPSFCLGTIAAGYVSGRPAVVFDGETTTTTRHYPYLVSYTPQAGDRVLIALVGHGGVILGRVM